MMAMTCVMGTEAAHWASAWLGLVWRAGARGPDAYDCWGMFLAVQRANFGRDLPEIPVDALNLRTVIQTFRDHPQRQHWSRVDSPQEGDAVLMRQSRYPVHVGVWLAADGGGVLHCVQGNGVVFQSTAALAQHGWQVEGCYRFTQNSQESACK